MDSDAKQDRETGPEEAEIEIEGETGDAGELIELLLAEQEAREAQDTEPAPVRDRVEIVAQKEIVLRCGRASITLTRAGKILIRGAHVVSRSSGVQRLQGATVQIN